MAITVPQIDDRNFEEILAEAMARIPVHNPEWNNFNDSDPGVTILQVFAFMTESLLYRSSLIPERNRKKFLQLLQIPLQPAAAAQGLVNFSNLKGALQTTVISDGLAVNAGQVPFQTLDGLEILPVECLAYYKRVIELDATEDSVIKNTYDQLFASYATGNAELSYYETTPLILPVAGSAYPSVDLNATSDSSLWLALLARNERVVDETRKTISQRILTLGVVPSLANTAQVLQPGGPASSEDPLTLSYEVPDPDTPSAQLRDGVADYIKLDARPSGDLLAEPGVVEIRLPNESDLQLFDNLDPTEQGVGNLPPFIDDPSIQNRLVAWLRIRLPSGQAASTQDTSQLRGVLSWVGINCARVSQKSHVFSERIGTGTGEPDQSYRLVNTPIIEDSVELTVNGERWQQIDDLLNAASEVPMRQARTAPGTSVPVSDTSKAKVFTVDRESGEIRFGDGYYGARPPTGAIIRANYDYGGGRQGNVGIGAINQGASLPAGVKVTNQIRTWGGDEAEDVSSGEKQIARYVQHRDRLVTKEDYETNTWRTPGVDLGRVSVLPLVHPQHPDILSDGVVTVLVLPKYDNLHKDAPEPDALFLRTICDYLNERRIITTEVHVMGPTYVDIWVSVGIDVYPSESIAVVREAVKTAIRTFLSPIYGGRKEEGAQYGTGWELQKPVKALELWAVAARVPGVSEINELLVGSETDLTTGHIPMAQLELPRLAGLSVLTGDPMPLEQLQSAPEPGASTAPDRIVPVPIISKNC